MNGVANARQFRNKELKNKKQDIMGLRSMGLFGGNISPGSRLGNVWIDTSGDTPELKMCLANTGWITVGVSIIDFEILKQRVKDLEEEMPKKVDQDASLDGNSSEIINTGTFVGASVKAAGTMAFAGFEAETMLGDSKARLLALDANGTGTELLVQQDGAYIKTGPAGAPFQEIATLDKTVNLTGNQTIYGEKSFNEDIVAAMKNRAVYGLTTRYATEAQVTRLKAFNIPVSDIIKGTANRNISWPSLDSQGVEIGDLFGHYTDGDTHVALRICQRTGASSYTQVSQTIVDEGGCIVMGTEGRLFQLYITYSLSEATANWQEIPNLKWDFSGKADKIVTPHIDWNLNNFNIPAGRAIQFDTSKTPVLSGTGGSVIAFFSPVNGSIDHMFGFYSDDAGVTTCAGTFHINETMTEFTPDILVYDGSQWLNGGALVLPYDLIGDLNEWLGAGTALSGFDAATDISIPDVPVMNLIDVYEYARGKQKKLSAGVGIILEDIGDGNEWVNVDIVTPDVNVAAGKAADARATAAMIAEVSRTTHNRGKVVSAYTRKQVWTLSSSSMSMSGKGTGYVVGDSVQYGLKYIDILLVVTAIDDVGAVTAYTVSSTGANDVDFTVEAQGGLVFVGGHGSGCMVQGICDLVDGTILEDISDPQDNDEVAVLIDETHSGQTWNWVRADYNGDGISNWVSLSPSGGARDFYLDPVQTGEIQPKAITDELQADYTTANPIVESNGKFTNNSTRDAKTFKDALVSKINGLITNKVDKTTTASRIYGTDASGNQTTYDQTKVIFEDGLNTALTTTLVDNEGSGDLPVAGQALKLAALVQQSRDCMKGIQELIATLHHADPANKIYINRETGNDNNDGLTSATAVQTGLGAEARLLSYTGPLAPSYIDPGSTFIVYVSALQNVSTPAVSLDYIGKVLVRWGIPGMEVRVDTSTGGSRARVYISDTVEHPATIVINQMYSSGVIELENSRFRDKRVIVNGNVHESSMLTFHNCDVNLPCLPFAWTAYTSRVIVGAPEVAYVGTPSQCYWRGYWSSTLILGVAMPDYGGQVSIALDDTCVLKGNLIQSLTSILNGTPVTIGHPQALETPWYDAAMVAPVRSYFRASKSGMAEGEELYVSCDKDMLFAAYRSSSNNWRMYVSALDGSSIEVQSFVTLQYGTTATNIGQQSYNNHAAATYHDITNGNRSFSGGGKAEALVYVPQFDKVYRFIVMCYGASTPLTCIAMVRQEL
jgi:hypothetical protein